MGFLSSFTNYKYADFSKQIDKVGIPRTASSTIQDATRKLSRVTRQDLETLYMTDAQTFKLVNSYMQLLLQAGYRIVSENKGSQKQYDDFFSNIGRIGMHYKLEQLLSRIIQDCVLYGHAYIERVYDETGSMIVDLKPIDAKLMDYVRDMKYVMMTDLEQNPLGYTMYVGYYSDAVSDLYPQGARVIPGYIFLRKERIANIVLSPFGNGFEGLGLVEPAYNQIHRKMKIEETASNAIFNAADSLIYAIVGDSTRSASVPLMNETLKTLQKWTTNRRAVFAAPTQIASMPVEQSSQVNDHLHYLRQDQAAAGGMSLGMAIGEDNNKSTQNTERKDFNTKLNSCARTIAEQFTSKILDVLYEVNGYGSKAIMKWNNVSIEDRTDIVALLDVAFKDGAITAREYRNYIKNVFDLETDDEDWERAQKELNEQTQYNREMPNQTPGSPLDSGDDVDGLKIDEEKQPIDDKSKQKNSNKPLVKKNIIKSKDKFEDKRE
jgi:hypothetical protein